MGKRRRRRDRRDSVEHRAAKPEAREPKGEAKRREAFDAQQRGLRNRQKFVAALAFVPLVVFLGCSGGLAIACQVPADWLMAIFAALFGSYLGIGIRRFLERRRFERGAAARSA